MREREVMYKIPFPSLLLVQFEPQRDADREHSVLIKKRSGEPALRKHSRGNWDLDIGGGRHR